MPNSRSASLVLFLLLLPTLSATCFAVDSLRVSTSSGSYTFALSDVIRLRFSNVTSVHDIQRLNQLTQQFDLTKNYPNPFNPMTTIEYTLPERSDVNLSVYNSLGQQVRTLVACTQKAGRHQAIWDGRSESGQSVASGVYYYLLNCNGQHLANSMIVLK